MHIRQLPAVGNPNPPKDLSEDIAAVRSLVEEAIGESHEVVVIPHSWAGIIAGSALEGMGKKEREVQGKKGGVTRAGYMAAFMLEPGVALIDCIPGGKPEYWWDIQVRNMLFSFPPKEEILVKPFQRLSTKPENFILTLSKGRSKLRD